MPRKEVSEEAKQEGADAKALEDKQQEDREARLSPENEEKERQAREKEEERSREVAPAVAGVPAVAEEEREEEEESPRSQVRMNIDREMAARGLHVSGNHDSYQLNELFQVVKAAGGRVGLVNGRIRIFPER